MTVPWAMLREDEQRDKIDAISECAKDAVRRAVAAIAVGGFPAVIVSIGAIKIDKGLEIKIAAAGSVENITRLAEHGKQGAILILVESSAYFGERAAAKPDPDQPNLPIEEAAE
jgi:predicted dinucleotide-utilizing enzyme